MIPEKLKAVLSHEGALSIVSQGPKGPHLIGTWNSYVGITPDGRLLIPAGGMNQTEANIRLNSTVWLLAGSKEVIGSHGPGAGFHIQGEAQMVYTGDAFTAVKQRFPWARAALVVKPVAVEETI